MALSKQTVQLLLEQVGAILTDDHFVYASGRPGRHGPDYINKDAVFPHTTHVRDLCNTLAQWFADDQVAVVIGPTIGGAFLAQWTADHLTNLTKRTVLAVYAEKEGFELASSSYGPLPPRHRDKFVIKRGYDKLVAGRRVLVVEDILNTGDSVKQVVEAVRACGGEVIGVGALVNRGGVTAEQLGVPKLAILLNLDLESYPEEACPLCQAGIPINIEVGHGMEFLASRRGYG